jgi:Protein of unknown function (DUF541)
MRRIMFVGLLAVTSVLFGQLDSNSITITASRSVYFQPDQAVFLVSVSSPLNATLDDIVAALQGSGVTTGNFLVSNVYMSGMLGGAQTVWTFTLPVPLSKMKDTITSLTTLQQTIAQKNSGFSLTFNVQGGQVSTQLRDAQQCPITDLVSDARTQAQKLADAAGLTLGPILALYDAQFVGDRTPSFLIAIPNPFQRSGDFSYAGFLLGSPGLTAVIRAPAPTTPALTCSITVKFTLLRYQ